MGTTKNPTKWNPQPLGQGYITTIAASTLTDQAGNVLTDQSGNALKTGTVKFTPKSPTAWSNTGS